MDVILDDKQQHDHRDVFAMNADELAAHLSPVAEQIIKQAFDQNLYISYPARIKDFPNAFIHEYQNSKVLVQIDLNTGKEHFIKNL